MLDDYYDYPSDVEEMFNELSRYEIEHPDLFLEREENLEGDDLEVMIPDRGATLPSHRFYSGCADEESETEPSLPSVAACYDSEDARECRGVQGRSAGRRCEHFRQMI